MAAGFRGPSKDSTGRLQRDCRMPVAMRQHGGRRDAVSVSFLSERLASLDRALRDACIARRSASDRLYSAALAEQ